jgi:glucan phosphoethanolaminetransferase (alkaline phosphatase superfamily)
MSFFISFGFLVGLATLLGTLIIIHAYDTAISRGSLYTLTVLMFLSLLFVGIAYTSYLRNIGRYIYGRIRPVSLTETECNKFKKHYQSKQNQLQAKSLVIESINNFREGKKMKDLADKFEKLETGNPELKKAVVSSLLKSAESLSKKSS